MSEGHTFPWYAWYPRDFLDACRGWSLLAKGAFREGLDAQWTMGSLPADPEELRRVIGANAREWRQIWPKIEAKFPLCADGMRRNARLEKERQKGGRVSAVRSALGRLGAMERWQRNSRSYGNSHPSAMSADGNSHDFANGKTMPSTSTSTNDPDSEATSSRKRARLATPEGARARPDVIDESDPDVQRERRENEARCAQFAQQKASKESGT